MPLYRPSELNALLAKWNTGAKKSLSQNFLIDGNIIHKIASLVPSEPGDVILEIGPGPGALTEALLNKQCPYYGIEKDTLFYQHLKDYFKPETGYQVFNEDVLEFSFEKIFEAHKNAKVHVAGNLPYSITSPILRKLSAHHKNISSVTIMVQDEVGRRMTANPKTKDYGLLTIGVQFYFDAKYAFKVSPRCFHPAPKVHSAVIHLTPKTPCDIDEKDFFKLVKKAFNVRRKSLRASLKDYGVSCVLNALEEMKKQALTRPEELSLDEWYQFYKLISH